MSESLYRAFSFHAPRNDTEETNFGLWATKPWTEQSVRFYRKVGGVFQKGEHEFADRAAATAAFD